MAVSIPFQRGTVSNDHSVGVCMCSYWGMRRKMKAALAKENSVE